MKITKWKSTTSNRRPKYTEGKLTSTGLYFDRIGELPNSVSVQFVREDEVEGRMMIQLVLDSAEEIKDVHERCADFLLRHKIKS